VESLHLASAQITFISDNYMPKGQTKCVSNTLLTFSNILHFVEQQQSKLKLLDFSRTGLIEDRFKTLTFCKMFFSICMSPFSSKIRPDINKELHELRSKCTRFLQFDNISKEAALVNRVWYDASLDPILQKDIVIHFYGAMVESRFPNLIRRKMSNLMLDQFDSSLESNHPIECSIR
jgi:hypothetical protein